MSGVAFARTEETADRLALASLLALGLHALLLFGGPAGGWALNFPRPSRFEVVLLTPAARPPPTASAASSAAPMPSALAPAASPSAEVSRPAIAAPPFRPEIATASPPPATAPVPPSAPKSRAPTRAPSTAPSVAPSKPSARKPAPEPPASTKPPIAAKTAREAPVRTSATAPPKTKPPKAEPNPSAGAPVKPRAATAAKSAPAPSVDAPDAALAGEPPRPSRPPERVARVEEKRPSASAGMGAGGRLNASALLNQVASLETAKQRREDAGVRAKRVSPNDTQSLEGFYIAAWMRKVEQIGEMNFPDVARKLNLNAGPVLDVSIRADGSLQEVRVARSSGNAELDRAAQRIVRLGAPYAPFSAPLRQRYDVLHIARPWRFEPGGRLRSR
ncbi:MAG: TonB family protein [Candidatus Competibacteraceae bacterium]|nr:TonB family protein [Candidatus Competibacteraceae bacterium]